MVRRETQGLAWPWTALTARLVELTLGSMGLPKISQEPNLNPSRKGLTAWESKGKLPCVEVCV